MKLPIFALLLFVTSCSFQHEKAGAGENLTAEELQSFEAIHINILAPKCLRCHSGPGGSGGVDLSSYETITAKPGLVVAGDANASGLYRVVENGDMPLRSPPLSEEEVLAIRVWIDGGAQ